MVKFPVTARDSASVKEPANPESKVIAATVAGHPGSQVMELAELITTELPEVGAVTSNPSLRRRRENPVAGVAAVG